MALNGTSLGADEVVVVFGFPGNATVKVVVHARLALGAIAAAGALGAMPAPARALTVTVAGDGGPPVALGGPVIVRTMRPLVAVAPDAGERLYLSATYTGPDGVAAAAPSSCSTGGTRGLDYRGNGTYTVIVRQYADPACTSPAGDTLEYRFAIAAGVSLAVPAGRVPFRSPDSSAPRPIVLGATPSPGALGHEVHVARDGVIGSDGGIDGPAVDADLDARTGSVRLTVGGPGRWTVVARAKGFATATGQYFSPWSAPVQVVAVAPFDLASIRLTDARGPSYRVAARLREPTARGRVALAVARGRRGGRFRPAGSARLSSRAAFAERFTLRRAGVYRLRLRFPGSATTAAGTIVRRVRITRAAS